MKIKKILITTVFLCNIFASTSTPLNQSVQQSQEDKKRVTHLGREIPSGRPNKPSKNSLVCIYTNNHLEFLFLDDIMFVKVILGDEMFPIWTGVVNKSYPETNVPYTIGETKITCEDDLGRKYVGILYFRD